jgi:hypothetical protein
MEELQSTEILDREILEDARKKAYRILKTAEDTVGANGAIWEQKTGESLAELNTRYAERRKLAAAEIMARLPVDKRRAKAERIESLIQSAVETWYRSLDRERLLSLLGAELAARIAECGGFSEADGELRAVIHQLENAEAALLLEAFLPGRSCPIEKAPAAGGYPSMVLENNAVRITASIERTVDFFLHEKRAELIGSLLGTGTPLDWDGPEAAR